MGDHEQEFLFLLAGYFGLGGYGGLEILGVLPGGVLAFGGAAVDVAGSDLDEGVLAEPGHILAHGRSHAGLVEALGDLLLDVLQAGLAFLVAFFQAQDQEAVLAFEDLGVLATAQAEGQLLDFLVQHAALEETDVAALLGRFRLRILGGDLEEALALLQPGQQVVGLLLDRKSTRLNSSHIQKSRMPSSA